MRRAFPVAALCLLAFALSCAYVSFYLRGGPRVIDATSYFLEARSLAAGSFSFHVPDPTAAFRGRFLLANQGGHELGVIFPPGYPFVLSLGVRLGAPLLVGPALGALLVAATYLLARALDQDFKVALVAATLSALCAALRYHTADTMSHGLATLLACAALAFAFRRDLRWSALLSGLCLGLLIATRPVSAGVSLLLCGYALRKQGWRAGATLLLGTLPGACLLLLQQRALTGSFFGSVQQAYYAVSDAPLGCFRYGFGAGIGCRFEHGDFVERYLPNGYGASAALRNLLVHLSGFASDASNAAPLSLLALYPLVRHARTPLVVLGAGIGLQALAYVPFYFDGNYPGGGARFLCEAIPFCQILVARGVCDLKVPWLAPAVAVAGFGLFARHGHEQLRDREGGRPLFEPSVVERAGVAHGLVFVDTDLGFNLGHDPRAQDARSALLVARGHGDAHDRELYERLGRPDSFQYRYDFKGRWAPELVPYVPPASARWEAEAEWPAFVERGSAYPLHFPCASAGRALRLRPGTRVSLVVPDAPPEVVLGWVGTGPRRARMRFGWAKAAAEVPPEHLGPQQTLERGCSLVPITGPTPSVSSRLWVELIDGDAALDFIEVSTGPSSVTR
jgi:uncharacterized membrane protein (UPF0136 family)